MAMYGLFLETERCPDGVEFADRAFRCRTERREPFGLELENLEHPVVVDFVNARDEDRAVEFLSKFGLPAPHERDDSHLASLTKIGLSSDHAKLISGSYLDPTRDPIAQQDFSGLRHMFFNWLVEAGSDNPDGLLSPAGALQAINDAVSPLGPINLLPKFDLAGSKGAPRMLLKCKNLDTFMIMEIAMVAMNGVRFRTCAHCQDVFLTGPLTGRRSHATYCSDRCRVAAMRARNAEHTKQEG
jgi:hypothetical protein